MRKKIIPLLMLLIPTLAEAQQKPITLEDIHTKRSFTAATVAGLNPMADGKHYSSIVMTDGNKSLVKSAYQSGQVVETIIDGKTINYNGTPITFDAYSFSSDENRVLLTTETEAVYRRSSLANNFVYDRRMKMLTPVSTNGKQKYATFSPDGAQVAFVRDNNLFIKHLGKGQSDILVEELAKGEDQQITTDGAKNKIINGGTDWVYEEEFEFARAFFWSPDGKKIAYYKFDETEVPEMNIPVYNGLYPEEYRFKYPKAGDKNAIVSIHVYDLTTGKTTNVDTDVKSRETVVSSTEKGLATSGLAIQKADYIPRIQWTNTSDVLCVLRMNRHQDVLEYLMSDVKTGVSTLALKETDKRYVEVNDDLTFLKDNKSFIISSERDGFNHLYRYDLNGKLLNQVTKGKWDVTALYGVNEKTGTVYYQAAAISPMQREVYAVKLEGGENRKLSSKAGVNNASFSADYSLFINNYSTLNSPARITLNDNKGKELRVLEDNKALNTRLKESAYAPKEFLEVPMPDGLKLNAWMIKPGNFDPNKKYPVLMYAYGGPGYQLVMDAWNNRDINYQTLADKGYIVFCLDNRGTGARGADFKKMTHMQLGKYEIEDQIDAGKWLGSQSYVDASRIGFYGWSFGGYLAGLAITKGADVFKMAISGAPVTSWRYYDTIYTERFLHTPQENASGYDDNSPINHADKMKGKLLLIHGTFDDNVHFQNSAEFALALIKKGKQFESFYYPNERHGVSYGLHLQTMMNNFIFNNL